MIKPLSILCVHGVGHGDQDPDLASSWSEAITNGLIAWGPSLQGAVTCDFSTWVGASRNRISLIQPGEDKCK